MDPATSRDYKALLNQGKAFFRDAGDAWARLEPALRATIAHLEREESEPHVFAPDDVAGWWFGPESKPLYLVPPNQSKIVEFIYRTFEQGSQPLATYGKRATAKGVSMAKKRLADWLDTQHLFDVAKSVRGIVVGSDYARFNAADSETRISTALPTRYLATGP